MAAPKLTCSIDDCARPVMKKGFCSPHYYRQYRAAKKGLPYPPPPVPPKPEFCSVEGCDNPPRPAGMCWKHYANKRRHGDPRPRPDRTVNEVIDDWGWDVTEAGCWEWRGPKNTRGYGHLSVTRSGAVNKQVHRLMYERHHGPIPEGHVIRHKCDNPPCSNPDHLETGTHADNSRDMVERGRHVGGPNQPFKYVGESRSAKRSRTRP